MSINEKNAFNLSYKNHKLIKFAKDNKKELNIFPLIRFVLDSKESKLVEEVDFFDDLINQAGVDMTNHFIEHHNKDFIKFLNLIHDTYCTIYGFKSYREKYKKINSIVDKVYKILQISEDQLPKADSPFLELKAINGYSLTIIEQVIDVVCDDTAETSDIIKQTSYKLFECFNQVLNNIETIAEPIKEFDNVWTELINLLYHYERSKAANIIHNTYKSNIEMTVEEINEANDCPDSVRIVDEVGNLLPENVTKEIYDEALSATINASHTEIIQLFKNVIGMQPKEYQEKINSLDESIFEELSILTILTILELKLSRKESEMKLEDLTPYYINRLTEIETIYKLMTPEVIKDIKDYIYKGQEINQESASKPVLATLRSVASEKLTENRVFHGYLIKCSIYDAANTKAEFQARIDSIMKKALPKNNHNNHNNYDTDSEAERSEHSHPRRNNYRNRNRNNRNNNRNNRNKNRNNN